MTQTLAEKLNLSQEKCTYIDQYTCKAFIEQNVYILKQKTTREPSLGSSFKCLSATVFFFCIDFSQKLDIGTKPASLMTCISCSRCLILFSENIVRLSVPALMVKFMFCCFTQKCFLECVILYMLDTPSAERRFGKC